MIATPKIEELEVKAEYLLMLLRSPHPGVPAWCNSLSEACIAIGNSGGIGVVSEMPDLLEACKTAFESLRYHGHFAVDENCQGADCPDLEDQMRAAIAKVEGDTSHG